MKKILILLIMATTLSGCVTIICNSETHQGRANFVSDEVLEKQIERIDDKKGWF